VGPREARDNLFQISVAYGAAGDDDYSECRRDPVAKSVAPHNSHASPPTSAARWRSNRSTVATEKESPAALPRDNSLLEFTPFGDCPAAEPLGSLMRDFYVTRRTFPLRSTYVIDIGPRSSGNPF
jgi:hypothetical protein